ncbi:MAG: tetratricopeptide repeat protein, partial [Bacteroidetes bacterium]|nr:tetratricopeptide repeat protein [Bacteroidota bacterium]
MKKVVLFFTCILLMNALVAQRQLTLQKADSVFKNKDYLNSIQLYNKALKKSTVDESKYIYFQLGECYRFGNNFNDALTKYQKSIDLGYDVPVVYLRIGEVQLKTGDYTSAKTNLENYIKAVPSDVLAALKLESCNLGLKGETEKPIYEVADEKSLNSTSSDYGIAYFKNGKIIYASTRLDGSTKLDPYTSQGFSDMYESAYDPQKGEWSKVEKLKGSLNTKYNEGTFCYDQNTTSGYYMQCNGESGKKLSCSIFSSKYNETDNTWGVPVIFDYNSPDYSVGHPSFSSDGKTLYFVSDMQGGFGGKDIYMLKKSGGVWGQPENLGSTVNTIGDEMFPFISGDTLLMFASDGHPGFGGLDIFMSRKKNGRFTKPVNMMPPVNSSADDFNMIFKDSKDAGLFCSNRAGGVGDDDIYSYKLIPVLLSASGNVKDKATGKGLEDAVVLFLGDDQSVDSVLTNSKGKYEFDKIKQKTTYNIKVYKTGPASERPTSCCCASAR